MSLFFLVYIVWTATSDPGHLVLKIPSHYRKENMIQCLQYEGRWNISLPKSKVKLCDWFLHSRSWSSWIYLHVKRHSQWWSPTDPAADPLLLTLSSLLFYVDEKWHHVLTESQGLDGALCQKIGSEVWDHEWSLEVDWLMGQKGTFSLCFPFHFGSAQDIENKMNH